MYLPILSGVITQLANNVTSTSVVVGRGAIATTSGRIYLSMKWDWTLILTSYLVSALGGYTATQLMTQVVTTKSLRARIFWVTLASLTFGGW